MNENGNEVIPTAGAVDLGGMKGGNRVQQELQMRDQMRQAGFMCPCGDRVEDKGVQLIGVWKGMVPTPVGRQDAAATVHQVFCSRECAAYKEAKEQGIGFTVPGPQHPVALVTDVVGERDVEPIIWFEKT